ncbi:filament-like plant protein 4 [Olea europaea var. sylvestris]|uniref:filament-like plant protein 4 n=1 Tax=Olea europaea var. sylvestris TaxID=158386 RepID=UPI000C1D286D|nr:filament-like plant protein 4 [Olea europaea var. sylvestris]
MDKRSWPWKKKSSEKQVAEKSLAIVSGIPTSPPNVAATQADQAKQDNSKKAKHVQISVESYTHLTGLENQVKSYEERVMTLEDEVRELNKKLSEANSEIINKENLVKQHAKVAEEAVSGWEKAEAEASALKNHLESVMLLKLTSEDRASQLDGALKECMRQIRNLKEEHEQKLHEVILNKTKQFDKMKLDLEAKIANLDQALLRSAAENAALSRSLQERSNTLIKLSEEKTQAEAEIEHLRTNIESCEKEIKSLDYELHIASKEIEIRNEEKNMSVRSADAANKQHLEGVKKIAKLEAECQRLRGLVRKKLPGPAALAQMKHEVENLGRDYGESHLRRFPITPPSPHLFQLPEFSLDNLQKYQKENELLAERLLAMEEETKILKEALSHRNDELQASRSICAQTASKLQSLEVQMQANSEEKSSSKSNIQLAIDGLYSQNCNDSASLISRAGDGNDDDAVCSGSCATAVTSELSNFKMQKYVDCLQKSETASHLDLMDDFLEMEKLALLSNNSNEAVSRADTSGNISNARSGIVNHDMVEVTTSPDAQSSQHHNSKAQKHPKEEATASSPQLQVYQPIFLKLQSKISVLKSMSTEKDMEGSLEDICRVVQDFLDTLHHQSVNCVDEVTHCPATPSYHQTFAEYPAIPVEREMLLSGEGKPCTKSAHTTNQEVEAAISQIYAFVMNLGKEAKAVVGISPDVVALKQKLDIFSAKYNDSIRSGTNLMDFVLDLSQVLNKAGVLQFNVLGYRSSEVENGSYDCIDKIVLPENKGVVDSLGKRYPNGCAHFSDTTSDPDISHDGNLVPTSESTTPLWECSLEEFDQLKLERDNMAIDLATCTENWENTKSQLLDTDQLLTEVKSQLTSAQKSNRLAETQLKCMAESYKSLETRAEEIQTEVNILHSKIESLDNELQEERRSHQDALTRCRDLQEQLQRTECAAADIDAKTNQEKELAAAAEKLAECQETIFFLGKRLKALRPQTDSIGSPHSLKSKKSEASTEEEPIISGLNLQDIDPAEMNASSSINLQRACSDSPPDLYSVPFSPSDSEVYSFLGSPISSKHRKHHPNQSGSSSASSTPTPEKHSRGFSRFFSSKGKNGL